MLKQWLVSHRSAVASATSGTVIAALVATVALVSTGYTAQRMELDDASVWVTSSTRQAVGRANVAIAELNSVVGASGADLTVVQQGSTVLLVDRGNSKVDMIDPATSQAVENVPLPTGSAEVFLAGSTVTVLARSTGEVWIVSLDDFPDFDALSAPTLSLGANAVGSMDSAGTLFVYSPDARLVYRLEPERSATVVSTDPLRLPTGSVPSITSVDGRWAVLDATNRTLSLAGRSVDLAGALPPGSVALGQATATGSRVLVAGQDALVGVPVDGGEPVVVTRSRGGVPAAPLSVGGCEYAAWTTGEAWRRCAGDPAAGIPIALSGMEPNAGLVLRSNGTRVALNDTASGAAWAVQSSGALIDNWEALIPPRSDQEEQQDDSEDTPPKPEKLELPPVAIDDDFGARPDRTTLLPVLLNDYDPNGDVLVISEVTPIPDSVGRVDIINERQQLQVTLGRGASGTVSFRYTITDGRGASDSATVRVEVRSATENSPPRQVRSTRTIVAEGGRAASDVLGDWVDPDGDAFYLTAASAAAPDTVSFTPQGSVSFTEAGGSGALRSVSLVVSDGIDEAAGGMTVTVRPQGEAPIIADPFVVVAAAGREMTISPLAHVRGGTGAIRLNSVPTKTGVTVTPSFDTGTFLFRSDQVATHYLEYVVTDGQQSTTGLVRVDVIAPPDPNATPITIPKTIFVQTLSTQRIDVAGTDIDPAGGVLVVTAIDRLAPDSGVSAEILEQRIVRVRLNAPLDGPVRFAYRVSNGLAEAEGTITVVEIPRPARIQPPLAVDDEITVRVGAAIDIPVLKNDSQPDGEELSLSPTLAQPLPDDAGLLFASGKVLRYLAPDRPGNFSAVYEVLGPDGQSSRATVRISVREADVATNSAPLPSPVTARVLSGETVSISIPLGIDPDGDSVQLLGQESSPEKGSVTDVGPDFITYRAGDYSVGTDSFNYTVTDSLGARATGTVRIGISQRQQGARNPVAVLDEVTVRPGSTVSVQVLANDSDPDGSVLTLVSAEPTDDVTTAKVAGDLVVITPPKEPGTYAAIYSIANALGGTSSNFVRVRVREDAPLAYPIARDSVLTLTDILGRDTIDVNVLANVFFADGPARSLGLAVFPGYGATAQVTSEKRIRVTPTDASQIIPFAVTHPDDPSIVSYAFIWVPGLNDALPQLNRNAKPLSVTSGQRLVIQLNDYVLAVGGRTVRLTDTGSVRATHADGSSLVVDSNTLAFTSADRYFGAASISFEVTDGTSATDPNGRKAILVLPITVVARDNQPPVFAGAVLEFEPGEEKTLDLVRLTNYPYPDDTAELAYTVVGTLPTGFTWGLDGQILRLRANTDAVKGSVTGLSLGVRDATAEGQAGRIQLTVVPSTKPLVAPAPDVALARRGQTTTVDVLANDGATNPFPSEPLRVVAIRGAGAAELPAGVSVTPSEDRRTLTVRVSATAEPVDTNLQYQVADATGDRDRYVWGNLRISVQDRPDAPTAVRVTDFSDRRLTVAWTPGGFNNSPITGYTVTLSSAATGAVQTTTQCSGSLCSVPTPGNGPSNGVRIGVTASNAIGVSDPGASSSTAWSDVIPAAPTGVTSSPLDRGLRISWRKPADPAGGSPITRYLISIEGVSAVEVAAPSGDPEGTEYTRSVTDPALVNGSSVGFTVSARNSALGSLANWKSASSTGRPAGPPIRQSAPDVSVSPDSAGTASVDWSGGFSSNGRTISNYFVAVFTGDAPTCAVAGAVPGSPDVPAESDSFVYAGTDTNTTVGGLAANTTYSFAVYAFNGMGCTRSVIVTATPRERPGTVSSINTSGPVRNGDDTWDFRLDSARIASGPGDTDSFAYRLSGGEVDGSERGPLPYRSFVETSNNSQYGQRISVEVKACQQYPEVTLCSADWSSPFELGVPVHNDDLGDLTFTHDDLVPGGGASGQWSWSFSPSGEYDSVTYDCDDSSGTLDDGAGGTCDVQQLGRGGNARFPDLTITIAANGRTYVRTYAWEDYE